MFGILGLIPGPWRIIGLAIAAAAVLGWIGYGEVVKANRAAEIARLNRENDRLTDIATKNAEAARQAKADSDRAVAAIGAELLAERARKAKVQIHREEITRVIREEPAACPVPASIAAVLDGLRAAQGDGAGDRAPGGAPAGAPDGLRR